MHRHDERLVTETLEHHQVESAIDLFKAALVFLAQEDLDAHEGLLDRSGLAEEERVEVELDLVEAEEVRPDLLVDVVKLLVGVGAHLAAGLVLEEDRGAVVASVGQGPREALHHDDLGLLEVDVRCVRHQVRVQRVADPRLVLRLQLCVLDERSLPQDLHEPVIHHLDLVWFVEMDRMIEHLATLEIFCPESIGYVDQGVSLVEFEHVAGRF